MQLGKVKAVAATSYLMALAQLGVAKANGCVIDDECESDNDFFFAAGDRVPKTAFGAQD